MLPFKFFYMQSWNSKLCGVIKEKEIEEETGCVCVRVSIFFHIPIIIVARTKMELEYSIIKIFNYYF